ncbi:FtsX-like permease family protein [Flavobacterium rakeshii]|uniref:FtsX-like permease family protein n=1 Tax=Flavobacterium rakeshii TaxID=1038845 RepID=A0A6N8HFH4_9FLAO|nr:ABC transporter permease [Flavobacterium rakeshii]MUV04474.1 FtsX-like permease family protein [Flavobacterium rakeshii]
MLKNWLKIFLYNAKKNKFFTALNTLGLSIGIAALIFAILYWNEEHSYNQWNPEKDTVFTVATDLGNDIVWPYSVYPLAKYMKEEPAIEEFCYFNNWYYYELVYYGEKKQQINILDTQKNFFNFCPFEFVKGDINNAFPDINSIVLEEKTAQSLFGSEDPIGKEIRYSGRKLVVRGVYKIPGKSSFEPDAVTNLIEGTRLKGNEDGWGNFNFGLMLKTKSPEDADKAREAVENIYFEYRTKPYAKEEGLSVEEYIKTNGTVKIRLTSLANNRLHSTVEEDTPEGQGNYQFMLIMLGLSVLILILSIVNYVNLATANAIKRAKEVGVRKILGATKKNIVKQFIFETVLVTIMAIVLALVIVELSLPYYNDFLNKTLVISSSQFYFQLIVIFFVVVFMAGMLPAVYVSNFNTLKVLRGNFGRSKNGVWLRNGMLVLQFAIAAFFIIGSYIVHEQVDYMSNKDLGLKGDQVIEIYYRRPYNDDPAIMFNNYTVVKQELSKIKGVQAVAAAAFSLGGGAGSSSGFTYNESYIQAKNMAADFGFLDMLEIKMVKGRALSDKFSSDTINGMMINETAMKLMREKDPVGKTIDWNGEQLRVVGVVKDFHLNGPQNEIPPMSFFHFKTIDWLTYNMDKVYVKISADEMGGALEEIEKFWTSKVDTEYPFGYEFVNKKYQRSYQQYVNQKNLFSLLNGVVILIALFGLFALASYSIQRKMKDIAIRKTLGAETKVLLKELSKQYILFCVAGFILATVPAWILLNKWLENFAYRIDISFVPFIIGFIVLMILTLVVVLSRAYAATRVNILKYLKYE